MRGSDSTLFYESGRRSVDDLRRKWAFSVESLMKSSRKAERCSICESEDEPAMADLPKSVMVWNPLQPTLEYQLLFFPRRHVEFPEQLGLGELIDITRSQSNAIRLFLDNKKSTHPEDSLLVFGGMNFVVGQSSRHLHFRLEGISVPSGFKVKTFAEAIFPIASGNAIKIGVAPPLDIVITVAEALKNLSAVKELCEYKLAAYEALHLLLDSSSDYRYPYTEYFVQSEFSTETAFRIHIFDHPGVTESCFAYEVSVDLSTFAEKFRSELSHLVAL